jgi:hypothetical protein
MLHFTRAAHRPIFAKSTFAKALFAVALLTALVPWPFVPRATAETVVIGEQAFVNKGLAGVGRLAADLRDKFGETFGSGSGMTIDPASWRRTPDGYTGTIYLLPDRGYNIMGTADYRPRLNVLSIVFKPPGDTSAVPAEQRQKSVSASLVDSILLTDADGVPLTGLDPPQDGVRPAGKDFPAMPQAANGHVAADTEAVVRLPDGGFFISDEYGPYIYRFSATGKMLSAIRPPDAFIPKRKGQESFASNNPGPGAKAPDPADPQAGRQNNQGFEGMSLTPDGKTLAVILQSATRQDGGDSAATRQNTRILFYDVTDVAQPKLVRENVVPLPVFTDAAGKTKVAAQSELLALGNNLFLLLCRDSGNGYGLEGTSSLYRQIELLDTSTATNIAGSKYDEGVSLAPKGKLEAGIVLAVRYPFIDINDNVQLGKFGLHNGAPNDRNNLSEKWEAMGLAPAMDSANAQDFFLFVANDNDFITQNGFSAGENYKDASGADVDTMFLVYRVTLPTLKK